MDVTFQDSGPGPSSGRPLVLVHGAGGSTQSHFGHLFAMMATRTRVIGVDLAPPPDGEQLTLFALTSQVRAAADTALGPGTPFDLLGYSLGAVVALSLAAELGDRVEHLVLVAGWIRTDAQQILRNSVWRTLYELDPTTLNSYIGFCSLSGRFLSQLPPGMLDGLLSMMSPDVNMFQQMELLLSIDLSDHVGSVTARTLIVSCTADVMVPSHHQLQLLGAIDDARLTSISSGHAVMVERPAQLMQVTDLFLRDPGRYPAGSVIPESMS